MPDHHNLAEKLEALEIKLAFQEDTIDTLNAMVTKQDKEIQQLWAANKLIKQSLNDIKSSSDGDEPEPPPPHY